VTKKTDIRIRKEDHEKIRKNQKMEQTLLFVEAVMILDLSSSLLLILLCTFCDHKKDILYKCFMLL